MSREAILVGKVSTHVIARMYSVFPGTYRAFIIRTKFALNFEKFVVINRIFLERTAELIFFAFDVWWSISDASAKLELEVETFMKPLGNCSQFFVCQKLLKNWLFNRNFRLRPMYDCSPWNISRK
jgi:hypothetical protein